MKNVYFIGFLIGFWIFFFSFQNATFYNATLGKISQNWTNINGERKLIQTHYTTVTNSKLIRWDACHYHLIKEKGYDIQAAGGDYIFAFFPLFPLVWKISHLPPLGMFFFNYSLFVFSIGLLLKLFSHSTNQKNNIMLSLTFPSLVIFLIPYTEATFLFATTIGVYGFLKNKYWLFFLGLFLASITRPAYTFLFLSFIGTEFFFFIRKREIVNAIKNCFKMVLPLLAGTFFVSILHLFNGSKRVFKFIEVQKYWDNTLSIPHKLHDWSHEGFGINIGILFLVFLPIAFALFALFRQQFKKNNSFQNQLIISIGYKQFYLVILSIIYLIGATLFIIFFRGGSLNCLFRFTLCTPFFFILLFGGFNLLKGIQTSVRFSVFLGLTISSIILLYSAAYSAEWNFSDTGIFILILSILFWLFQDFSTSMIYKVGLYFTVFFNLIWTTYLFNMYLNDGWIFA